MKQDITDEMVWDYMNGLMLGFPFEWREADDYSKKLIRFQLALDGIKWGSIKEFIV